MKLKKLEIHIARSYEANAGRYVAEVEYEGKDGGVNLLLTPEVSEALLLCIGPVITKFSHQASLELEDSLIQSVQEARQSPAIEAPKEAA